jgi:hypothetical protein
VEIVRQVQEGGHWTGESPSSVNFYPQSSQADRRRVERCQGVSGPDVQNVRPCVACIPARRGHCLE